MKKWLRSLEKRGGAHTYLWPNTPTANLQAEIWRRCGASDLNFNHPNCRTGVIIRTLQEMLGNHLLPHQFRVLDLCCGDGVILEQIARSFHFVRCFGVDTTPYPAHKKARRAGVSFHYTAMQEVIASRPPRPIDVFLMLNTFRGWDRAKYNTETESDLPQKTLAWMKENCNYIFVTVTKEQQEWLKRERWFIWDVGKGEDESRMMCGFHCDGPGNTWTDNPSELLKTLHMMSGRT